MTLRPVVSTDFPFWLILWEQYNSFYKRTISPEITESTWKRFLDPNEPIHAIVCEVNGKIVAFTTYLFHRHTAMVNDVCYLQDLYTGENFRGKGIGKALIQNVSENSKSMGSVQVYWMTHESNDTARILYDKIAKHSGFIVYSKRT